MKFSLYFWGSFFLLCSCEFFDYHQLDGKVHAKNDLLNNINITKIENLFELNDSIRFAFTGDTHRDDYITEKFVKHINDANNVDFIIHAGDITDFGIKKEYEVSHRLLSKLHYPYVVLIGNHDIIAHGDLIYRQMYGDESFSFVVLDTHFICLNTNRLEYKKTHEVPDLAFLDYEIRQRKASRTVLVMHSPPKSEQFNDEETLTKFNETTATIPDLLFCLHGHTHKHSEQAIMNDSTIYFGCDNIAKRSYIRFVLTKNNYYYERVFF